MLEIVAYSSLYYILSVLEASVINESMLFLAQLSSVPVIQLLRIEILLLFTIYAATSHSAGRGLILVLVYAAITQYFYPVVPSLHYIVSLTVYSVCRLINQSFLIREFYGGSIFVAVFVIIQKIIIVLAAGGYLGLRLPYAEMITTVIPLAVINGLIAAPIFSGLDALSRLLRMSDPNEYIRQT